MSGADGGFPCYRHNATPRIWSSYHRRWITAVEKMNSLMFPVYSECAEMASVPRLDLDLFDCSHHAIAGNSMCVGNFILVLAAVTSCVEVVVSPPTAPAQPG
eukprot:9156430-Pyramimonas_sp.AAC.1